MTTSNEMADFLMDSIEMGPDKWVLDDDGSIHGGEFKLWQLGDNGGLDVLLLVSVKVSEVDYA